MDPSPESSIKDCELLHQHNGEILPTRSHTLQAMRALTAATHTNRTEWSNVHGSGHLLLSDVPASARSSTSGIVLGVDEAGRGSVIGPMIYGMAYWDADLTKTTIPTQFNDSKQLSESQRQRLYDTLLSHKDIGYACRVLQASEISRNMLRGSAPYNLNEMSHDSAIAMMRPILESSVNVQCCYIDTVGNPLSYRRRLEREFPGIDFVVESKADDSYAPCSAASIVAKVARDAILKNFQFSEPHWRENSNANNRAFGSGYPSDPICKRWLADHFQSGPFAYPDIVRFSWKPIKDKLTSDGSVSVVFAADDIDPDEGGDEQESFKIKLGQKRQSEQMASFLKHGTTKVEKRLPYFVKQRLASVESL